MTQHLHLEIELKGPSPDLGTDTEGVSLPFFTAYATRLREAYRRSAQGVVSGVVQDDGRLPTRATQVDIRLKSASEGSLNMQCAAVDLRPDGQQMLIQDYLAQESLKRLMDGLEEAARVPDSEATPRAFRVLIGGIGPEVRQTYRLTDGVRIFREIVLTSAGFDAAPDPVLAAVERVQVVVRGVTFSPKYTVTLEVDGSSMRVAANAALVQRAIGLHDETDLVATIVTNSTGARLLNIATASEPFPRRRPELDETLERFAGVMKVLAR